MYPRGTHLAQTFTSWPLALLILLISTFFGSPQATGSTYDPLLNWYSIETPNFIVHYHDGEQDLAREVASKLEAIHPVLTQEIGWVPKRRTHVAIVDPTDSANGSATTVPNNRIMLYATAPTDGSALDYYEHWLTALLIHEYTHILHIDMIDGLPLVLRRIFGRMIMSNDVFPRWIVEGYAVYQESQLTEGGRARSTYGDMVLRMATLDGDIVPMRNAEGFRQPWPGGNIRYLWGGKFITWVAEQYGPEKWTDFNQTHSKALNPLAINWHAYKVFGKSLYALWDEWQADLKLRSEAIAQGVVDAGLIEGQVLVEAPGNIGGIAWSPNSQWLYYAQASDRQAPGIFRINSHGQGPVRLPTVHAPRQLSMSPHGSALYYATVADGQMFSNFQDVFALNLDHKDLSQSTTRRLTQEKRARDPAIHPDGHQILVVQNDRQNNTICTLTPGGELIPLVEGKDHTQFHKPRWSPGGEHFAVSQWFPGGNRDIVIYNRQGQFIHRLSADRAVDTGPEFSPDGRYLLFASDRTGIPNLFALDLLAGPTLYQVSNVIGGAFDPRISPNGEKIAFRAYSSRGYELRVMPFSPQSWREATEPLPVEKGGPLAGLSLPGEKAPEHWPEAKPYRPIGALFPPRLIAPDLFFSESGYAVIGASTFGRDPISTHRYDLWLNYRTDAKFLSYGLSYKLSKWRTELSASASTQVVYLGQPLNYPQPESSGPTLQGYYPTNYDYFEVRTKNTLTATYPLSANKATWLQFRYECREPLFSVPGGDNQQWDSNPFTCTEPMEQEPLGYFEGGLADRGNFSGLSLGWRHRFTRSYARSISPETGNSVSVSAQLQSRYLGADYERQILVADWRHYISVPWDSLIGLDNHVIATRLATGAALGDTLGQSSFRLGGSFGTSTFTVVPSEFYALRGYGTASDTGDRMLLGSLEYRLPLLFVDQGLGTLPLYARGSTLTIFADVGNAFEPVELSQGLVNTVAWSEVLGEMRSGTGLELTGKAIIGYGMALNVRLGYAVGWNGGYRGDLSSVYLQLGSSF